MPDAGRARGRASSSWSAGSPRRTGQREDSEDVKKANNRWTREEFETRAPGLDWAAFFDEAGLGAQRDFIVWQPRRRGRALGAGGQPADRDLEGLPAPSTRSSTRRVLPDAFGDERFAFHGTVLAGTPKRRERWKRARGRHELRAGRGRRPAVRRAALPARGQGARARRWSPTSGRLRPADRRARLDGARHQGEGQGEAGRAEGGRRLSRPLARLLGPEVVRGDALRQRASARSCSSTARSAREARPARRPRRNGS